MTPETKERIEQIRNGIVPEGYKATRKGVIPNEWSIQQIRDFAVISSGSTPNRGNPAYWNGDIPWVTTGELKGGYVTKTNESITMQALSETSLSVYPIGTLLMAMYGQGKTRGTVAKLGIEATVNQACAAISLKEGNPEFVFHALQNAYGDIRKLSNAGNQENLNADIIKTFSVMFPPIAEQTKIAEILATQDKVIELEQQKIEEIKKEKKFFLSKMFPKKGQAVPEIRFKGFTDAWEQRKLGEMASLITKGTTPLNKSNTGEVNFVKIESIDEASGEISITQKITNEEHEGYLRRSQLKENDILFSIAGTLGRVTSVESSILPANTNQALAIIRLKNGYLQYVKAYLKGKAVSDYIKKNPTIGAQPNLSLEQVGSIEIALPSVQEQRIIGDYFRQIDNLITLHQRKLEEEKQKKKALMQLLLMGIVRV